MAEAISMPKIPEIPEPVPGYPQLASHIAEMSELGIYSRFGALNARNILYYQAELAHLEIELLKTEKADYDRSAIDPQLKDCASDWYWLGGDYRDTTKEKQLKIFQRIREIIPKYSK